MSWFRGLEHIVREQETLAPHTWLRLGGAAEFFAEPTTREELIRLVKQAAEHGIAARVLGGGSNLLVPDAGVPGLVLHLSSSVFCEVKRSGNQLLAGGGAKLSQTISAAVREGLLGLEDLIGIPGTVGGALHGNAGGQHDDIGTNVSAVSVLTHKGDVLERSKSELHFAYRSSSVDELVILSAAFQLEPGDPAETTKRMQRNWIVKQSTVPSTSLAQACMFKDAGGQSAAALIEQAGLRGTRVGDAAVSERHANFVLAGRNASAADVRELLGIVAKGVKERLGVRLEPALVSW